MIRSKNTNKCFIYIFVSMMLLAGTKVNGQEGQGAAAPEKPKNQMISGTVNHVDAFGKTITVYGEKGVTTISVPDDVKIMRRTERLHLDEINAGDSVRVECKNPEPGKYVAVSILDSSAA